MHLFPLDFFDFSNLTRVIWNMRDLTMDGACWHTGDDTFTYQKSYKLLNVSETSFWRGCSSWGEGEGMDKGLCRYNCNETKILNNRKLTAVCQSWSDPNTNYLDSYPVFIFTSGSSALFGRPRCGLSIWLSLLTIFNTLFWVYANFFHEETDKTRKYSKILAKSY